MKVYVSAMQFLKVNFRSARVVLKWLVSLVVKNICIISTYLLAYFFKGIVSMVNPHYNSFAVGYHANCLTSVWTFKNCIRENIWWILKCFHQLKFTSSSLPMQEFLLPMCDQIVLNGLFTLIMCLIEFMLNTSFSFVHVQYVYCCGCCMYSVCDVS